MTAELPDLALFAERLKAALKAAGGMSPSELARRLKVNRATVSRWLGGGRTDFETIEAIATELKCAPRWLAGMTEEQDHESASAAVRRLHQKIEALTAENERLHERLRAVTDALKR